MPDSEFRVPQSQFAVRGAVLQYVARKGYALGQKPEFNQSLVIERRATSDELGLTESEKYNYQRDPDKADVIILWVRVDFLASEESTATLVRLRFKNTNLDTAMAFDVQGYLLDARSYALERPHTCPRCSSTIRDITARFCGKCGENLLRLPSTDESPVPIEERAAQP